MELKEYYNGLNTRSIAPKTAFKKKLAKECGVTEMTVSR